MDKKTKILCILDGFGLAEKTPNNAVSLARMPNLRRILKDHYWTTLDADGEMVGQETGLVGNSEVGHMNIGGLKLIPQLSYQITKTSQSSYDMDLELAPNQLFDPKKILQANWKNREIDQKIIHLVGLFSTGTIHSDLRHWVGAIEAAGKSGASQIVMHIISDGRDSDRESLVSTWNHFVSTYQERLEPYESKIKLGSIGGRFYAMDRDKNFDRTSRGVLAMIHDKELFEVTNVNYSELIILNQKLVEFLNKHEVELDKVFSVQNKFTHFVPTYHRNQESEISFFAHTEEGGTSDFWESWAIDDRIQDYEGLEKIRRVLEGYANLQYYKVIYDEHLVPKKTYQQDCNIQKNETVWLINFRSDRMKQIGTVLTELNEALDLNLLILANNDYSIGKETILNQDSEFELKSDNYYPIFKNKPVENTLAETISKMGQTQLHVAETEKYNHVTYFLNGGQDKKWPGEDWYLIPSNKVHSHGEMPEMKAREIADYIVSSGVGKYDYIIANFANADMVGHTGDLKASIQSVEFLDEQLGKIIDICEKEGHQMLITADHGNVEVVGEYETSSGKITVDTEHNANAVPCIIVSNNFNKANFVENLHNIKKVDPNLNFDPELVMQALSQKNNTDLSDENTWLTKDSIPKPSLHLWYSGLFLLGL